MATFPFRPAAGAGKMAYRPGDRVTARLPVKAGPAAYTLVWAAGRSAVFGLDALEQPPRVRDPRRRGGDPDGRRGDARGLPRDRLAEDAATGARLPRPVTLPPSPGTDSDAHLRHLRPRPDHVQFRVLPAQVGRGGRRPVRHHRPTARTQAVVRVRHLRGRRRHPGPDPRPDHPHPARDQPDGRVPPDVRLPQPAGDDGHPRPVRRRRGSKTSWPWAATRPRRSPGTTARRTPSGTPRNSSGSSAAGPTPPTRAGSASASPGSPKATPGRPTGSSRWTT